MKGETAYRVHSVTLHCIMVTCTAPGIEDKMTHERGGEIERGTLEDAAVPEKEIAIMTDAIVATRMTENVNLHDLVASPDHGS